MTVESRADRWGGAVRVIPVSAALLVRVALEARGPGAALWESLKGIVKRSSSLYGAQCQLDSETLDAVFHAPLRLESAQAFARRLSDCAQADAQLLSDLDHWARQALELRPTLKHDVLSPDVIRTEPAVRSQQGSEAHFVVYGGSRGSVGGETSEMFTSL